MLTPPTLGERLALAREQAGLTQEALAKKAKVKQSTIGNIEAGLRKKPRDLVAIARAAKCSPDWLASGEGTIDEGVPPTPEWPFELISRAQWSELTERQRGAVEAAALRALQDIQRQGQQSALDRSPESGMLSDMKTLLAEIAKHDAMMVELVAALQAIPAGPSKALLSEMLIAAARDPEVHLDMMRRLLPTPTAPDPQPTQQQARRSERPAS